MKLPRALGIVAASALFVAACGSQPVTLRTGSAECYDGSGGDLAFDPATGAITFDSGPGPVPVQWPLGYTGQRSGSQVEIINASGRVLYRTGTRVSIMGDSYSPGVFKACNLEPISP